MNIAVTNALKNCDIILSQSVKAFYQSDWLDPLTKHLKVPFLHVYPKLLDKKDATKSKIELWLKGKKNVFYVSFGTVASPSAKQIKYHIIFATKDSSIKGISFFNVKLYILFMNLGGEKIDHIIS
jgi:hypothetical protein